MRRKTVLMRYAPAAIKTPESKSALRFFDWTSTALGAGMSARSTAEHTLDLPMEQDESNCT